MKCPYRALCLLAAAALAPASAFAAASALGESKAMSRLVTPNGDGRNDTFIFRCHNPRDSAIEARIYDLHGGEVGKMRLRQRSNGSDPFAGRDDASGIYYDLEWDPNSGAKVPGGVYMYQITVETKVYKGTVVVIR
ncbi:MAG: gliding motility-associated C-terminal domain-containing protein [Elusimicrobia bacterium]|nr:gliding motility-associated C-terminal domain-containing protein [Elusimicrobiota bacterium]